MQTYCFVNFVSDRFFISSRARWSYPTEKVLITFRLGPVIQNIISGLVFQTYKVGSCDLEHNE